MRTRSCADTALFDRTITGSDAGCMTHCCIRANRRIAKVEVERSAVVRRAKLYFLRDRIGKAVRLKERRVERKAEDKPKSKRRKRGKKAEA